MTITAETIMLRLYWRLGTRTLLAPNFTPACWYECDLLSLTGAGYWTEYEIKLTYSDFRADRQKHTLIFGEWNVRERSRTKLFKHDQLRDGHAGGPHRFYYVAPVGTIPHEEVPTWAGLIECRMRKAPHGMHIAWVKKAPRLHDVPADYAAMRSLVLGRFYHRYWQLRCREERNSPAPAGGTTA